jgi:hypothetical protein
VVRANRVPKLAERGTFEARLPVAARLGESFVREQVAYPKHAERARRQSYEFLEFRPKWGPGMLTSAIQGAIIVGAP